MPVDGKRVQSLHGIVRSQYKGGYKSANKIYDEKAGNNPAEKRQLRAINSNKANEFVRQCRPSYTSDAIDYGGKVLQGVGPGGLIGNCVEMASVAAWYASFYGVGSTWIASMDFANGGHVFTVVSDSDSFTNCITLNLALDRSDAWVIDPWMNCCCPLRQYPSAFREKCEKWEKNGKRILGVDEKKNTVVTRTDMKFYLAALYSKVSFSKNWNRAIVSAAGLPTIVSADVPVVDLIEMHARFNKASIGNYKAPASAAAGQSGS